MEIIIKGEPKEIADLVSLLQSQPKVTFDTFLDEDCKKVMYQVVQQAMNDIP